MIIDRLNNIGIYKNISNDIYEGLLYLQQIPQNIKVGVYCVSNNIEAIVSEYPTVECFERGYEAHKHHIDIQYPIIGLEKIKWAPIEGMKINIPYEEEKDRTFYKEPGKKQCEFIIGDGVFSIMFPEDGHSPQHLVDYSQIIKKVTIKVKF